VGVGFAKEILGDAEVATFGSLKETCGCARREGVGFKLEMVQKMWSVPLDRPHGRASLAPFAASAPSRFWPPIPEELSIVSAVGLRRKQALTEPPRDWHANGISDQLPSAASLAPATFSLLSRRPISRKTLESFCIADIGRY
jgi:hypothetical protein